MFKVNELLNMLNSINSILRDCEFPETFPPHTKLIQDNLKKSLREAGRDVADLLKSAYIDLSVKRADPTNPHNLCETALSYLRTGQKINAIKADRDVTVRGLKESKDVCDEWIRKNGYTDLYPGMNQY